MIDPYSAKGENFFEYTDEELEWFLRAFPNHAGLKNAVQEIERRSRIKADKHHTETVGLAEKSIAIGVASQKTNSRVLAVSIAALIAVIVLGFGQCIQNRHSGTQSRATSTIAPSTSPQPSPTPTPSSQSTAQPEISPTTCP
ncbi:MAG: hypothetical protein ACREIF_08185 [Chthoniobacterales bacterium]